MATIRDTQTFRRIAAAAPYILAAFLFAGGLFALYKLLAPVDFKQVAAQIRATPWRELCLALLTTFGGYLALAGYDWSALRYIGKPLPGPVVVVGGMMAYAFGNTIGLSAVSGGAVRWRLYSALGLDAYDVAAVSSFAALSFGVAATLVGLGAVALHPEALANVLPVAAHEARLGALALVAAIAGPLLWASVTRRELKMGRFRVHAPSVPVLGGQVVFSLGDIGLSAMTLYVLLPASDMGYLAFLAVFAAATMAGILSHVPGGVGVFETVVIAAMPHAPIDQVAAALLLYRLIYYLVPFVLALVVLAAHEAVRLRGRAAPAGAIGQALAAAEPAFAALTPMAPLALAVMVFGSGLWMSVAALIPATGETSEAAETLFPLAFVEGAALLSSALGAGLIVLALGVVRRNLGAFWFSVGAMATGIAVALAQGFDVERAGALALAIAILLPFRRAFHRQSFVTHAALTPAWLALMLSALTAFGFVLFFATKSTPYAHELWWQFAVDENAPRALRAGLVTSLMVGLASLVLLLRAPRLAPEAPDARALADAARIAAACGDTEAAFALTGDKALLFSEDREAFVMYAAAGRSWIALGGPVGADEPAQEVAFSFVDAARRAGARPAFYEVDAAAAPVMIDLGFALHKMGEEALVDLTAFSLDGASRKRLRAAHARGQRDGLTLEIVDPPHAPALEAELRSVSDEWLQAKQATEKGFSVGRFEPAWLNRWPIALVRAGDRIVAFATLLTADDGRSASVDLMRHRSDAPKSTMDFLFCALMLALKARGARRFSLGMAPLSGLRPERSRRLWDRFGLLIFRHGGHFYNFRGLRAFKEKFDPEWRPRYLAAPSTLPPLLTLADAARLIGREAPTRSRAP